MANLTRWESYAMGINMTLHSIYRDKIGRRNARIMDIKWPRKLLVGKHPTVHIELSQSVWRIWIASENFPTHIGSFILYPHWTQSQVPGLHADATVSVGKVSLTSGNVGNRNSQANLFICVWRVSLEPENRTSSTVGQDNSFSFGDGDSGIKH